MCGWITRDGLSSPLSKVKVWRVSRKYLRSWSAVDFKLYLFSLTPIMDAARARYSGSSRKLVIALDIGTTFSGAAYALLDPGEVPRVQSVTRQVFPPTPDPAAESDEREVGT